MDGTIPKLEPGYLNHIETTGGSIINAYYHEFDDSWQVEAGIGPGLHFYTMDGIDAAEWPEVWADIMETEREG